MIAALILCVLLFAERLTGGILHAVLGLVLLILTCRHVYTYRHKIEHQKKSVVITEWFTIAMLLTAFITGIFLHPLHEIMWIKLLHKLSAVLFVAGMLGHVRQVRNLAQKFLVK